MSQKPNALHDPDARHPRARELMADEALWDGVCDAAPFGSDEGVESSHEFVRWRAHFPRANLTRCLDWILQGKLEQFDERLLEEERIEKVAAGDEAAGLLGLNYGDVFTLDATIIATALSQLAVEGRIDPEAKSCVRIALRRQLHPTMIATWRGHADLRRELLEKVSAVIDAA